VKRLLYALYAIRNTLLSLENRRRLRKGLKRLLEGDSIPIFFIFMPDIVHFAPYCIPSNAKGFEPVLILNSVSLSDEHWLKEIHPKSLIISLRVSLAGNPKSVLTHGQVLSDLFATVDRPFCIQDPDCFVTHLSFWKKVKLDLQRDIAGGPFVKKPSRHKYVLPNTYFLIFNPTLVKMIFDRYGINANATPKLGVKAQKKAQEFGYAVEQYPEEHKNYFDTLQALWVLAFAEGLSFKRITAEEEIIFHIGGTSYLHRIDHDLSHWDYWALSVIYFNLRLLELPLGQRFHERFRDLMRTYGTSNNLLDSFPEFVTTWRFREMQTILSFIIR